MPWGTLATIASGALGSGAVLKLIDYWVNRRRERTDERMGVAKLEIDQETQIRRELVERLNTAIERTDSLSKRIDDERGQRDVWHQKYWDLYGQHEQAKAEVTRLQGEVARLTEELAALRQDVERLPAPSPRQRTIVSDPDHRGKNRP